MSLSGEAYCKQPRDPFVSTSTSSLDEGAISRSAKLPTAPEDVVVWTSRCVYGRSSLLFKISNSSYNMQYCSAVVCMERRVATAAHHLQAIHDWMLAAQLVSFAALEALHTLHQPTTQPQGRMSCTSVGALLPPFRSHQHVQPPWTAYPAPALSRLLLYLVLNSQYKLKPSLPKSRMLVRTSSIPRAISKAS